MPDLPGRKLIDIPANHMHSCKCICAYCMPHALIACHMHSSQFHNIMPHLHNIMHSSQLITIHYNFITCAHRMPHATLASQLHIHGHTCISYHLTNIHLPFLSQHISIHIHQLTYIYILLANFISHFS